LVKTQSLVSAGSITRASSESGGCVGEGISWVEKLDNEVGQKVE
jgi:hypothetical protein